MYYKILVASQRFHGNDSLTYSSDENLSHGQLVRVPLQRQSVVGIIESAAPEPVFPTKPLDQVLPYVLPSESLQLLRWLHAYYPSPLGLITELFTPPNLLKKTESIDSPEATNPRLPDSSLTQEQSNALQAIAKQKSGSYLVHGDTGTGKTRLYIELAADSLKLGRSVIILTPEIGLTAPLQHEFEKVFGSAVIVTHSEMTPATRRKTWLKILEAQQPQIIIGPRSALFAPTKNIGLIVMDECHDTAYKQEQVPYYQTSRVAAQLAKLHKARFVMGSATPPVSDYFTFQQKNLPIIRMTRPATGSNFEISSKIIDHRDRSLFSTSAWLSTHLLAAIQQALDQKEQTLLFLNRRGSARLVLCENCGWQAFCPHCDVPLTYHQDDYSMRCHSCDNRETVPSSCPSCHAAKLLFKSIGTKGLEIEVKRLFPNANVFRFDRDTEAKQRLHHLYQQLQSGAIDIIIGTQAIAKGFDLPRLGVVGIVQADSGLQIPDFTANERAFQLISQVSGRIGRGHRAGELFVQTYNPDSSLLQMALTKNYENFFDQELKEREAYHFPPYFFLAKIISSRASSKSAYSAAIKVARQLREAFPQLIIEGPAPRFVEKIAGKFAWQLVLKSTHRHYLVDAVRSLPSGYTYDLDPSDLL